MAKISSAGSQILLDEFDISGYCTGSNRGLTQELAVVTTLSDAGPRRITGNYDTTTGVTGFGDYTDTYIDEIMDDLQSEATPTDHYLCQLFGAHAAGAVGYEDRVRLSSRPINATTGSAQTWNVQLDGSLGTTRVTNIFDAAVTATVAGTGYNLGVTTAPDELVMVARITAATALTTITIDLQESSDDGAVDTYANITGMQIVMSAVGVSEDSVVITTEAWKKVNVSAWTGTSANLLVTVGHRKGT